MQAQFENLPIGMPMDVAMDLSTDRPVSANQALLDELKCEVEQFLGSARTERFTVVSPNGGLRTEVRDLPPYRNSEFPQRAVSGFGALG